MAAKVFFTWIFTLNIHPQYGVLRRTPLLCPSDTHRLTVPVTPVHERQAQLYHLIWLLCINRAPLWNTPQLSSELKDYSFWGLQWRDLVKYSSISGFWPRGKQSLIATSLVKIFCFQLSALKRFHFTPCLAIFFSTENINAENFSVFLHIFQRWKRFTLRFVSPYFSVLKTLFFY
jgi:hypothetical protein